MRSLAVLGVTALVGCGLDVSGAATLGSEPPANEASSPEPSSDVDATADIRISGDGSGLDADASTDASDSGIGVEATPSLDAYAPDATTITGDANADAAPDSPSSDGSSSDGTSSDGSSPDSPSDVGMTSLCVSAIPSGWSLVIYDLGSDSCPSSFPAHDVSGTTTIQSGACSCSCRVAQNGDCAQGTLTVHPSAGNSSCDLDAGWSKNLSGSGCTVLGMMLGVTGPHSDQATPLAGQGGTCTDTPQTDTTKVTAAAALYCDVPPSGADSVCNGTVPSGFAACIMTNGETTCPSGSPFVNSYLVEDGATVQCSSCAGCTVTTTCSNATLTGYSDMGCAPQSVVGSVDIDGGCNPVSLAMYPSSLVAIEYSATPLSACTSGSSTASLQLTNPRTLCCR